MKYNITKELQKTSAQPRATGEIPYSQLTELIDGSDDTIFSVVDTATNFKFNLNNLKKYILNNKIYKKNWTVADTANLNLLASEILPYSKIKIAMQDISSLGPTFTIILPNEIGVDSEVDFEIDYAVLLATSNTFCELVINFVADEVMRFQLPLIDGFKNTLLLFSGRTIRFTVSDGYIFNIEGPFATYNATDGLRGGLLPDSNYLANDPYTFLTSFEGGDSGNVKSYIEGFGEEFQVSFIEQNGSESSFFKYINPPSGDFFFLPTFQKAAIVDFATYFTLWLSSVTISSTPDRGSGFRQVSQNIQFVNRQLTVGSTMNNPSENAVIHYAGNKW